MKKLVNNYKYGVVISLLFVLIFYIVLAIIHSGGTFPKFSTIYIILLIIPVIFALRSIVIGYILIHKNKPISKSMLGIIINLVIFGMLCYLIYWSLIVFVLFLAGPSN